MDGTKLFLMFVLPSSRQTLEYRLVKRALKLDASDVPGDPADRPLDRCKSIEPDPHEFTDRRPFDELDLTARRRQVEDIHPEAVAATSPNASFKA